MLYTNIYDFAATAAASDPEQLCAMLAEHYFNPLSDIALEYNGTVDKYIGDSIVVIYGAPVSHDDDARQAVFAALDMRERMALINDELANQGLPPLPLTVSIATQEAVVGLFGSTRKREYSALGPTLSIAVHLEERAQADQILIDEATYLAVRDSVQTEGLEPAQVKGLPAPIPVYNVLGTLRTIR